MTKRFLLTLILLAALVRLSSAQVLDTQLVQNNSSGGACTAVANSCASFTLAAVTSVALQVSGTWTGTLTFEATTDGTNWNTVGMKNLATGVDVTTTTANGSFATANVGLVGVRARATAAITGSASVAAARGYASVRSLPFSSAVPVPVTSGGTGFSSYAVGDLLTANTTTSLAKLADVAAGSVLVSGGVNTVPAWSATPSVTGITAASGTLVADAQALSTTATWNNAAIAFTHWKAVVTDTASAAGSLPINFLGGAAGATTLFSLSKTGVGTFGNQVVSGGNIVLPLANFIGWGGARTLIGSPSDGVVSLYNNAGTDFGRLQFGGTTSSFPALKRSGAGLSSRLADDTADSFVTASFYNSGAISALTVSSNTITPTSSNHQVGAGLIKTITVPAGCTPTCTIFIQPTAAYTYDATGNILLPSGGGTAVISKLMVFMWNGTKWVPSY